MDLQGLSGIFLEGILSFFSPCVLPLIPLYMSYLAGEHKHTDEDGITHYEKAKVFLSTFFFVLGICLTFFLLCLSLNFLKDLLDRYGQIISIIGGTLLVIFGLHECGLIHIDVLNREWRPGFKVGLEKMNFLKAFLLGFVFSLGWSPCIGPLLANALLMAATSSAGYLYIVVYGLGLIVPFLITGLFTEKVLDFIGRNKKIMRYVMILAGVILILFGVYMIHDASRQIMAMKDLASGSSESRTEDIGAYLIDHEFKDVQGNRVRLSDYKGKYLMLNFTTTWCTYCKMEIPEYQEFAKNEEVECFYVMAPVNEGNGRADIDAFVKENDLQLPVIIDADNVLFYYCGVNSYPTTYIIDPEGHFICYANGAMSLDGFNDFFEYAKGLSE
ncbi:MAG: redoxin domain-containing protein [Erysipelotrichaceae bacterium]|nr:redoxin domain-containing protein [Erysipelotrichaceae bacterium]